MADTGALGDSRQDAAAQSRSHRGVLYPARLPTLHRLPPPDRVAQLVRWFWIPEWDIAPGRRSRQHLIAFPACNLVVEPDKVIFAGPTTCSSYRDLTGKGWAVGALLWPAAVPYFSDAPAKVRDRVLTLELPALTQRVCGAMNSAADRSTRHRLAVDALTDWLADVVAQPSANGLTANAMADLIDSDPTILTIESAAVRLHVSTRTLQRLARSYVGLPPSAMIRRRRLQEAAQRIRVDPSTDLTTLALELGYADHSHLANEFRSILGFTPSAYRRNSEGLSG